MLDLFDFFTKLVFAGLVKISNDQEVNFIWKLKL